MALPPRSRGRTAARGLLLFAVWVLLDSAHAQILTSPPTDTFAYKPLGLPPPPGGSLSPSWSGCLSGNQVAAIEVWILRMEDWDVDLGEPTQFGAIAGIKLYFTDKVEGTPRSITIGSAPKDRISDGFLSFSPGEYITRVVLTTNGNRYQTRLGGIVIVTSKGQRMDVTTKIPFGGFCPRNRNCPQYSQTVISQSITENRAWLGSGTFCGLLSQLAFDMAETGISDISFVFLQKITDAIVFDMTYPADWQAFMPALNPITSAMIKLDNRKGPVTTMTLTSKQGSTSSGSITITNGSSMAGDVEVRFGLSAPKVPGFTAEANIYNKASWDLSTEQETTSSFSNAEVQTDTCKVQVAANSWAQVAFVQYQATYTLPYTGRMKLSFVTGAELEFDTSGTTAGVASASTSCIACTLDANGCCPAMSKDGCPAPAQTLPRRSLAAVRAGAAKLLPVATSAASSMTNEASGAGSQHRRQLLQADPSLFLQSAYAGQRYSEARNLGTDNCLDGYWLATIKVFKCNSDWAACGIGLYYDNGVDTRFEGLGNTDANLQSLGECKFGPNDPVISGTIWNNNRCPGSACRWGKLELVKSDGSKCSIQVSGFGGGQAQRIGPSTRENIGAGLVCGVRGFAGADVDGLALMFMRAVAGVQVANYSSKLASFGVPGPSSFGTSNLDNSLSTPGELTTDIELTQGSTQSWREKNSNKMGSQTKFDFKTNVLGLVSTGLTASKSYTQTDTITSTGSVADSSTFKMTVMSPVPSNTCVQIMKTRIQGARTGTAFNATRNILFDNGVMRTLSTQGNTDFNISTNWILNTSYCKPTSLNGQMVGSAKPGAKAPSTYAFKARSDVSVAQLLRQLSAAYGVTVARLKQLNPSLPAKFKKGASIKFVLKPQLPTLRTDTASYLLLKSTTKDELLRRVAAEHHVPLKTLQRFNHDRLRILKKGSTVKVILRLPRRQSG